MELADHNGILFTMRVADTALDWREVLRLTFDGQVPRRFTLPESLRLQTAIELEAIASHDRMKQADVLTRVLESDRLSSLTGAALVSYSRSVGLRMEWVPEISNAEQFVDFGLALLLDDSQPWGKMFFRCQLEGCKRFFIAKKPRHSGQYRWKYCCREHQQSADKRKVGERVAAFNAGMSVREWRLKHK